MALANSDEYTIHSIITFSVSGRGSSFARRTQLHHFKKRQNYLYESSHSDHSRSLHDTPADQGSLDFYKDTSIQCIFCDCRLDTRAMYQKHMNECHREKNALPFSCSMCQKGFFSLTGLKHHIEAHNGRQFVCAICDAKFQHKHNLKRHVLGVHKLKECPNCAITLPAGLEFNSHLMTCGTN